MHIFKEMKVAIMTEYVRQSVDPNGVYSNNELVYIAEGLFDVYGEKEPIIYEDFAAMKARIDRIYDEMNFRCQMVPLHGYEYFNVCDVTRENCVVSIPADVKNRMDVDNVTEDIKEKHSEQNNWNNVPGTTGFTSQFYGDFSNIIAANTDAFYVSGCARNKDKSWPVNDSGLNRCGVIFYRGSRPVILLGASHYDINSCNFKAAWFSTMNTQYDAYSQYIMMLNVNLQFYNEYGLHETGARGKRYGVKAIALTPKNLETFLHTMYFGPVSSSYPETSQAYIDWAIKSYTDK